MHCLEFYKLYEKLFGKDDCSYNVHVFSSHITQIRCAAKLTKVSAAPFEASYAPVRNSCAPGTQSVGQQVFHKDNQH
jgi:hypothetical protein